MFLCMSILGFYFAYRVRIINSVNPRPVILRVAKVFSYGFILSIMA